jgi:epoxide hydrolase-like predicted phosphatase
MCDDLGVKFEAVIFDIGGVLELTPSTGWQRKWARSLGLREEDLRRRLTPLWRPGELGHSSLSEIERRTATELALNEGQLKRLTADIWAEYLGTLNTELASYFTALRPRYRTGILSNSLIGAREREQAAYGFENMCDVVVYSHEEGMAKPDHRIYELICARLTCDPARAIFVDDKPLCIAGARAAGLHAIQHRDNPTTIHALTGLLAR